MADHLKNVIWFCIAGLSGAFTSVSLNQKKLTPLQIVFFIISGGLTAMFTTPLIAKWVGLESQEVVSGLSFMIGASWQFIVGWALEKITGKKETPNE